MVCLQSFDRKLKGSTDQSQPLVSSPSSDFRNDCQISVLTWLSSAYTFWGGLYPSKSGSDSRCSAIRATGVPTST